MIRALVLSVLLLSSSAWARPLEVTAGGTGVPGMAGEQLWWAFEEHLEANPDAELTPKMLVYGELGAEENLVSGIRRGRIQVSNWSALAASTVVPELALIYSPFLFDSEEEVDFIFDNYLFEAFEKLLDERGVVFLTWAEIGFNQIYGKRPIIEPADAEGVRFRVSSSESAVLFAESIGADAIPLGFTDIISGLQTGLIEAGEQAPILYIRTGIAEDAPHLTISNHSFATSLIVTQKRWFNRLTDRQKEVIRAAHPPPSVSRPLMRDEWKADLLEPEKWGFQVHRLSPEQRAVWVAQTEDARQELVKRVGGDAERIYDLILEGKRAFAAQ